MSEKQMLVEAELLAREMVGELAKLPAMVVSGPKGNVLDAWEAAESNPKHNAITARYMDRLALLGARCGFETPADFLGLGMTFGALVTRYGLELPTQVMGSLDG